MTIIVDMLVTKLSLPHPIFSNYFFFIFLFFFYFFFKYFYGYFFDYIYDYKDDYKDDHDDNSRHAGQDAGNSRGFGERGLQLTGDRILLQFWRADDELDRMGELSSDRWLNKCMNVWTNKFQKKSFNKGIDERLYEWIHE